MSLFGHLAVRFGTHPENLATEGLGYVLKKSAAARKGFLASLRQPAIDLPSDLTFTTQHASEDQGRPDLAATDDGGELRVLVEAKFDAGFTVHQPNGYLEQLPDGGVLVVICPTSRVPLVWQELMNRVSAANLPVQEKTKPGEIGHAIVGTKHLVLQSWKRALNATRLELSGEPEVLADVVQLDGLCTKMESKAFVPVTSEELTSNVYRRVHEFGTIVDDVVATLAAEGTMSTKGGRATGTNGWYGRYARLRGAAVILQVSTWKWTLLGPSPLWLTIYGSNWQRGSVDIPKKQLAAFAAANPGRVKEDSRGYPTILLRVPVGVERVGVIGAVMDQLRQIGEIVAPLGGPDVAPPPDEVWENPEAG